MAGRAGAILPIALGVVLARWGGAVGAPRPSQRLRAAIRIPICPGLRSPHGSGLLLPAGRSTAAAPVVAPSSSGGRSEGPSLACSTTQG